MAPKEVVDIIWKEEIAMAKHPDEVRQLKLQELLQTYVRFPFHAGEQLMVNEIIDPRETRPILIRTLEVLANKQPVGRPHKKHSLVPR